LPAQIYAAQARVFSACTRFPVFAVTSSILNAMRGFKAPSPASSSSIPLSGQRKAWEPPLRSFLSRLLLFSRKPFLPLSHDQSFRRIPCPLRGPVSPRSAFFFYKRYIFPPTFASVPPCPFASFDRSLPFGVPRDRYQDRL